MSEVEEKVKLIHAEVNEHEHEGVTELGYRFLKNLKKPTRTTGLILRSCVRLLQVTITMVHQ